MPSKVWAVGEEVLAADFNDYVQEQVVSTFANAAARDAAIPAPNVGQVCFLQDALSLFQYEGTAWRALPRGRIGSNNATGTDRTQGLSILVQVSFTLPVARLVRIEGYGSWSQITAASNASQYLNVGYDVNRQAQAGTVFNLPLSASFAGYAALYVALAAGAHTAEVHCVNNSTGSGAMRFTAGAAGGWVAVSDVGGV